MSHPLSIPNAFAAEAEFEFAALNEAQNYREALLRCFSSYLRGNVLEVGAGIGQMTAAIKARPAVEKIVAVEPETKFQAKLLELLPPTSVVKGTAHDVPAGSGWNCLVSVNVLEHIEHDEAELALYRDLLGPRRGALCLLVPARPEIYAPIDRDFGHFRRYTRPELRAKLGAAGFAIESLHYYNSLGYFAWWLSFRLLGKRGFDARAVRFYDRAVFPFVSWTERHLAWPPFGQSLMAIARPRQTG